MESSITGDVSNASNDLFHVPNVLNDPFHVTDMSDPFVVSIQSFQVPGLTESASAAPAAREFVWKLPKLTVEEIDNKDDWQSTNTFPSPAQPQPWGG
jgi:hypothetical protein